MNREAVPGNGTGKGNGQEHEHAVENGIIRHLSVSQIKTFVTCERKWFFSKVRHLEEKKSKGQDVGTEGHQQIEHYLKHKSDVLGEFARRGKHLLPTPGPDLEVEAPLAAPPLTADGIPFEGYVDIINPRGAHLGVLRLTDHKFTKRIEDRQGDVERDDEWQDRGGGYAALPADLTTTATEHGIQMIGYARWAFLSGRYPWAKTFELQHIYYPTQGPASLKARPVMAAVSAQAFDAEWKRVDDAAKRMRVIARAQGLDEVPANWNACHKYGGCSFQLQCLIHQSKDKSMGVMDRVRKAQGTTSTPPPAVEAPAPTLTEVAASTCTLGERYTFDGRVGEFTGTSREWAFFQTDGGSVKLALSALVTPLGSATPAPAPAEQTAAVLPPDAAPRTAVVDTSNAKAEVQPSESSNLQEKAPEEEKPKRTRKARHEIVVAPSIASDVPAEAIRDAECAVEAETLRVYVDAVPNCPARPLAEYLAPIVAAIETAFGLSDIRCAPKKTDKGGDHPLAFGGWKGALAGAVKASPPPPGVYVALGVAGSELMQVATEALESVCAPGCFVRGVRS